jgi:O-antigen/teichoic acid export membrane protein
MMNFPRLRDIDNPLYRNAILLMLNSIVLNGFGFIFWTITVRLYAVRDVGLATTMLSSLELILVLALAGFNVALIRYLPGSKRRSELVSSCFIISGAAAAIISGIFMLGLGLFSPGLLFLRDAPGFWALYVGFAVAYTLFTLIDAVFIGLREARLVVFKNLIFGAAKLALPFLLVAMGTYGIFASVELAAVLALAITAALGLRQLGLSLRLRIDKAAIAKLMSLSAGNYFANILFYAPTLVLPLVITSRINPETTAYFYFAIMIYSLLAIIPTSVGQSLLTEGSQSSKGLGAKIRKATMLSYALLAPAAIIVILSGDKLLLLFGKAYSDNSIGFLRLLAASALLAAANILYIAVRNIQHKPGRVIMVSMIISAGILGFSQLFIGQGLIGIGLAWIAGQLMGNCFVAADALIERWAHGV